MSPKSSMSFETRDGQQQQLPRMIITSRFGRNFAVVWTRLIMEREYGARRPSVGGDKSYFYERLHNLECGCSHAAKLAASRKHSSCKANILALIQ